MTTITSILRDSKSPISLSLSSNQTLITVFEDIKIAYRYVIDQDNKITKSSINPYAYKSCWFHISDDYSIQKLVKILENPHILSVIRRSKYMVLPSIEYLKVLCKYCNFDMVITVHLPVANKTQVVEATKIISLDKLCLIKLK